MAIYTLLLPLTLALSAPWWLWRMVKRGRYREGLAERLGFVPARLREAVVRKKVVWVHAVSVGEVLAAERMIAELRDALPGWVVVVSTTTATGQKIARERLTGVPVFYLPLDFAFAVRRYLRALRPSLLVLMENEMWPRLLTECERNGIPVALANARVSDRSFNRSNWWARLWRPILLKVSLFLAQGPETAERLVKMGVPAERVRVTGNLKYDAPPLRVNAMTERLRPLLANLRVVVAGSTLRDEEHMMVKAFYYVRHAEPQVFQAEPNSVLIVAPRHPQRFDEVADLIENFARLEGWVPAFRLIRASELSGTQADIRPGDVILLDTLGDLAAVYELAHVAFVGGSLADAGGHNPLEPARFGVPVMMGPYYANFREVVAAMIAVQAIHISGFDYMTVAADFLRLMREGSEMGLRGKAFFDGQAGATRKTVEALVQLLERGV